MRPAISWQSSWSAGPRTWKICPSWTPSWGEEQEETGDFVVVKEKDKVVNLTEQGVAKVERFFQIENLADPENLEIQHNIILALRANNLMVRDKDYVVKR